MLTEIDNSTVCLPLLYSAMIHSTSTKAQMDILEVFKTFHLMTSRIFFCVIKLFLLLLLLLFFFKHQQEATLFCYGAVPLILALQ